MVWVVVGVGMGFMILVFTPEGRGIIGNAVDALAELFR